MRGKVRARLWFLVELTICMLLSMARATAGEVRVLAAASLSDVLGEAAHVFEQQGGAHVVLSFGASSLLVRQIENAAPCDLFISADERSMDQLQRADRLVPKSRKALLANTLCIIAPATSTLKLSSPSGLVSPEIKTLALGEPSTVPAGVYAREYLEKLGLWPQLKERVVPMENVRAALAAVESGNADAGIVYQTDALGRKRVRVLLEIPAKEGPRIVYPLALIAGAEHLAEAERFAAFLESPTAQALFGKFGFQQPLP